MTGPKMRMLMGWNLAVVGMKRRVLGEEWGPEAMKGEDDTCEAVEGEMKEVGVVQMLVGVKSLVVGEVVHDLNWEGIEVEMEA